MLLNTVSHMCGHKVSATLQAVNRTSVNNISKKKKENQKLLTLQLQEILHSFNVSL